MALQQSFVGVYRRFPLATICLALWLLVIAGLVYRFGALAEGKSTLARTEAQGKTIEKNVLNGAGFDKQAAALQAGLARLESRLIRSEEVGPNQQYFYDLEQATGVKLSVLRPVEVAKSKGKTATIQSYQPVGYNVVIEGRFSQVVAFVRALEQGTRHCRLVDCTLQRANQDQATGGKGGVLVLNLNLELLASS